MSKRKVVGVGGVFFKSEDPQRLNDWYAQHLGMNTNEYGATFEFRNSLIPEQKDHLQFSPFPKDTKYFDPSTKPFMINFRVEDLRSLLKDLKNAGVVQIGEIVEESYGLFAHIMDPEGNKIELWQPDHKEYEKVVGDEVNR